MTTTRLLLNSEFDVAKNELAILYKKHFGPNIRKLGSERALDDIQLDLPNLDFNGHNPKELSFAAYTIVSEEVIEMTFEESSS
jgi:hypothetical protein